MEQKLYSCCVCKQKLSSDNFYSDRSRRTYLSSKCKSCTKPHFKKYRDSASVKIAHNLRRRMRQILKSEGRSKLISEHIGCTKQQLVDYLESQFTQGMSWANYGYGPGKWVIDHIKPISIFLKNKEDISKANHYTNLRPCWYEENAKKRDKF